jgi:hypothetical protein
MALYGLGGPHRAPALRVGSIGEHAGRVKVGRFGQTWTRAAETSPAAAYRNGVPGAAWHRVVYPIRRAVAGVFVLAAAVRFAVLIGEAMPTP